MGERNYCEVRLIVATKDDDILSTEKYNHELPPTNEQYSQMLYQDLSYTDFASLNASDIQYIVAILDWFALDGQHSTFSMTLNTNDVWPDYFETDIEFDC